jgi:thioredoxin-like negative regulator of GroEL
MRINIDIHQVIANYFGVSAIPAVFIIKDRTVVSLIRGYHPMNDYVLAIDEVLAKSQEKPDTSKTSPGTVQ